MLREEGVQWKEVSEAEFKTFYTWVHVGTKRRKWGWEGDIEGRKRMIVPKISDVN